MPLFLCEFALACPIGHDSVQRGACPLLDTQVQQFLLCPHWKKNIRPKKTNMNYTEVVGPGRDGNESIP